MHCQTSHRRDNLEIGDSLFLARQQYSTMVWGTARLRESLATAIDESLEKDYGVDLKIPEEAKDKFGILRFVTREGCNVVFSVISKVHLIIPRLN